MRRAAPPLLGFSGDQVRRKGRRNGAGWSGTCDDSTQETSVVYLHSSMYCGCHESGKPPHTKPIPKEPLRAARPGRGTPLGGRGREARTDTPRPVRASPPSPRPQGDDVTIRTNTASALNRAPAYRLQLVFDAGPTMSMWRPLLRELRQSLARSGPFQSVAVAVLKADGTRRGRPTGGPRAQRLLRPSVAPRPGR